MDFDSKTQIRVLKIEPGQRNDPLVAEFEVYNVFDQHDVAWEAVSYSWDGQTPSQELIISGRLFHVTSNVVNILKDLRLLNESRRLWIDAVCISQNDPAEKSHQVALMGTIYEKAHSVTIWLSSEGLEDAAEAVSAATRWIRTLPDRLHLLPPKPLMSLFIIENPHVQWRSPFHRLLALGWFDRVWVVQEGVLARNLFLYCGGNILSWDELSSTALKFFTPLPAQEVLTKSVEECYQLCLDKNFSTQLRSALTMIYLIMSLREWMRSSQPLSPSELVFLCSDRRASVQSDKVYGMAGLFGKKQNFDSGWQFPIDYQMAHEEVFKDFTLWCIRHEQNLDVLAQQFHRPDMRDITGWVTDWSTKGTLGVNLTGSAPLMTKIRHGQTMSSNVAPSCRRVGSDALVVRGFMIDMIGGTTEDEADPPYIIGENIDDERLTRWYKRIPHDERNNRLLFGQARPTIHTLEQYINDTYDRYPNFSHLWRDGHTDDVVVRERIQTGWWGYDTKRGCLALTVGYLDPHTPFKICYLNGGRALFVLRPTTALSPDGKPAYILVTGDCYIDGFENGQGYGMAQRLGLEEEDIYLV